MNWFSPQNIRRLIIFAKL